MKQNQFKFKPFDQVLVRDDDNDNWYPAHYKCYEPNKKHPYICDSVGWRQCIPYNEETKHLYNTNNSYQKPEQKEYHVWTSGTFNEWMTESEFKNFIETAVIHNKDITDFHVLRIRQ
mgnify:CR=1 FL=1